MTQTGVCVLYDIYEYICYIYVTYKFFPCGLSAYVNDRSIIVKLVEISQQSILKIKTFIVQITKVTVSVNITGNK